jgi:hypothetical protein
MRSFRGKRIGFTGAAVILLAILMVMQSAVPCFAGSLSRREKKIISRAEGTFRYEDATFFAYGKSIDKLTEYLEQDGVDLSKPLAEKAEKYMKDPVYIRMAIASGYLYPVGTKDGKTFSDFDRDDRFEDEEALLESDFYRRHGEAIESAMLAVSSESLSGQITLRKFTLTSGKSQSEVRSRIAEKEYDISVGVKRVMTVLEILVLVSILYLAHLSGAGSARSAKLKRTAAAVLTVGIGINIAFAGLFFVFRSSLGSYDFLRHAMAESSLPSRTCEEMKDEMQKILIREGLADEDAGRFVYDHVFENEYRYIFNERLKGQHVKATSSGIATEVFQDLKPHGVNRKIVPLETEYNFRRAYRHALHRQPAGFIHTLWSNIRNTLGSTMLFCVLMLVFGIPVLLAWKRSRAQALRTEFVISAAAAALLTAVLFAASPGMIAALHSAGLGSFTDIFMRRVKAAAAIETAVLIAAAILIHARVRTWKILK